ncbi:TetR/AcrR family transcriptional regulator [Furfurilactobacillus curtus]|uniref:TetR family transcriptional regulator n=1 Tax=Furfurilactobacillus curtus TaxID=1746200 RepID=A0ABQ5JPH0_9LACO
MADKRRRGAELERAIFSATIKILDEEGLQGLTFQKVAERAGTSKPVLYRRWNSPLELVVAAIREPVVKVRGSFRDYETTGNSLAEDLFQLLQHFAEMISQYRQPFVATTLTALSQSNNIQRTLGVAEDSDLVSLDRVLQRARTRGEAVRADISRKAKLIAFEQIRYEGLFIQKSIEDEDLRTLINDVLLRLFLND